MPKSSLTYRLVCSYHDKGVVGLRYNALVRLATAIAAAVIKEERRTE